jgi:hypothetical protein
MTERDTIIIRGGREDRKTLYTDWRQFYTIRSFIISNPIISGVRLQVNKSCPESRGSFCFELIELVYKFIEPAL